MYYFFVIIGICRFVRIEDPRSFGIVCLQLDEGETATACLKLSSVVVVFYAARDDSRYSDSDRSIRQRSPANDRR